MSIKTETIEFYKDEGGKKDNLLINFYTEDKVKLVICYTNEENFLEKILPNESSKGKNFFVYDIINIKTKTSYKNSIKIVNNFIEFAPKKAAEYQLSFKINKASRNMWNALFYLKMINNKNTISDYSQNKILIKSKRKIPASERTYPEYYFEKIIVKNNKQIKFTSHIFLSPLNKPRNLKRKKTTLSEKNTKYQRLENEILILHKKLEKTVQELEKYKKRYEYDIDNMLSQPIVIGKNEYNDIFNGIEIVLPLFPITKY